MGHKSLKSTQAYLAALEAESTDLQTHISGVFEGGRGGKGGQGRIHAARLRRYARRDSVVDLVLPAPNPHIEEDCEYHYSDDDFFDHLSILNFASIVLFSAWLTPEI